MHGPRVGIGWLKWAPNLWGPHAMMVGASFGTGKRQENHGDNHWLEGTGRFWGVDFVYKYDSPQAYGKGDWQVQGEYIRRTNDSELVRHDNDPPWFASRVNRVDVQDGYYVEAVYGFAPRWRAGLRWEQVGLANRSQRPNPADLREYDATSRISLMTDFNYSEFSRLRFGVGYGRYETLHDSVLDTERLWDAQVQLVVMLGHHPAHKF